MLAPFPFRRSDSDPLDYIERYLVAGAIVELGGARTLGSLTQRYAKRHER